MGSELTILPGTTGDATLGPTPILPRGGIFSSGVQHERDDSLRRHVSE